MNAPPTCPSCRAPLVPAASRCHACGAPVPAGWMIVANIKTGTIQCAGKLGFTNGDNLTYDKHGLRSEKDSALKAVLDDFESQFEEAATKEIKALTEGKARLGYKVIE